MIIATGYTPTPMSANPPTFVHKMCCAIVKSPTLDTDEHG